MGKKCSNCGTIAPETETPYTLLGSKFGWRLRWENDPNGAPVALWRCPACWKAVRNEEKARGAG